MPKSGQQWDPQFLSRSSLLTVFASLAAPLTHGRADWPSLEQYTALAEARRLACCPDGRQVAFSPAAPKRVRARRDTPIDPSQLYDGRIVLRGEVPCLHASYHDWFNALAWASFPRAKRAVHERQFEALCDWLVPSASRLPNRRTREQDALTLFDEGGAALVIARAEELPAASGTTDLNELRCAPQLVLFGHAAMEHLVFDSTPVRIAAMVLESGATRREGVALLDWVDAALELRLRDTHQFRQPSADRLVVLQPPHTALV